MFNPKVPQKKNSIKWNNIKIIAILILAGGLIWNAANYRAVEAYKKNYVTVRDTCTKAVNTANKKFNDQRLLASYYQGQVKKMTDSCTRMKIAYLNGTFKKYSDTTSSFWYVSYETNKLSGYDVIKLSSKGFSLNEAQATIKKTANIKEPFLNIIYFNQVSERCWAEYQNAQK